MPTRPVFIQCLVALLLLVPLCAAAPADNNADATFLLSVRDGHDCDAVAASVVQRAADARPKWTGRVERVHRLVNMLIVRGDARTCAVLGQLRGVEYCEPDSVISLSDAGV